MTDLVLRPLLKSDFTAVLALWRDAAGPGTVAGGEPVADAAAHALLAALQAERTVIVAALDGRPAGFVVVDLSAGRAEPPVASAAGRLAGADRRLAAAARRLIALTAGRAGTAGGFVAPRIAAAAAL